MNLSKCFKHIIVVSLCMLMAVTVIPVTVLANNYNASESQTDCGSGPKYNVEEEKAHVLNEGEKYTVSFNTGYKNPSGTVLSGTPTPDDQKVEAGGKAVRPSENPSIEGYKFAGWYADAGLANEFDFNTPITKNTAVYAKYEPITYTIRFNINGGFSSDTELQFPIDMVMRYDEVKAIPDLYLAKNDHFFAGWADDEYADSDDVTYFTGQKVKNLSDTDGDIIDLYAVYEEYITRIAGYLSDNYDWGQPDPIMNIWISNTPGNTGSSTARPSQGYRFVEWQYIDGTKVTGEYGETIEGAKITPAKEQLLPIKVYVAHFEPGTAQYTTNYYTEGENGEYCLWKQAYGLATTESTVTVPIIDPGPEYHHDPDVPGTQISGEVIGNGSLVLSVYYTRNRYSVTWNNMDGTALYTEENVPYGTTPVYKGAEPQPVADPHYTGYSFAGWTPQIAPVASNAVYTAIFNKTPVTYTVTFNTMGGTAISGQTVEYGGKAERPANPARKGYAFGGWYTTGQCLYEYDFGMAIDRNITIYAKWKPTSYAVKYNLNGGSFPDGQAIIRSYTIESEAFQIVNPEKEGAVFKGWTGTGIETPSKNLIIPKGSTGDMELAARWGVEEKYEIIEGKEISINPGSPDKAIFRADIPFDKFHHVEIDEKTISAALYNEWEGSTYVQLKEGLLKALAPGRHSIRIVAKDGGCAKTMFTLTGKAAEPVTPAKPIEPEKPVTPANTGDDFDGIIWLIMIAVSVIVIAKVKTRLV